MYSYLSTEFLTLQTVNLESDPLCVNLCKYIPISLLQGILKSKAMIEIKKQEKQKLFQPNISNSHKYECLIYYLSII